MPELMPNSYMHLDLCIIDAIIVAFKSFSISTARHHLLHLHHDQEDILRRGRRITASIQPARPMRTSLSCCLVMGLFDNGQYRNVCSRVQHKVLVLVPHETS